MCYKTVKVSSVLVKGSANLLSFLTTRLGLQHVQPILQLILAALNVGVRFYMLKCNRISHTKNMFVTIIDIEIINC